MVRSGSEIPSINANAVLLYGCALSRAARLTAVRAGLTPQTDRFNETTVQLIRTSILISQIHISVKYSRVHSPLATASAITKQAP